MITGEEWKEEETKHPSKGDSENQKHDSPIDKLMEQVIGLKAEIALLRMEREILRVALNRISGAVVAWKDEEANALLESVGNCANEALGKVNLLEGSY